MKKINKYEKDLVLARVRAYDEDFQLSIGGSGTFSKNELLKQIEDETAVGREIIEVQMEYLRDLVTGNIYKILES